MRKFKFSNKLIDILNKEFNVESFNPLFETVDNIYSIAKSKNFIFNKLTQKFVGTKISFDITKVSAFPPYKVVKTKLKFNV